MSQILWNNYLLPVIDHWIHKNFSDICSHEDVNDKTENIISHDSIQWRMSKQLRPHNRDLDKSNRCRKVLALLIDEEYFQQYLTDIEKINILLYYSDDTHAPYYKY